MIKRTSEPAYYVKCTTEDGECCYDIGFSEIEALSVAKSLYQDGARNIRIELC